MDNLILEAIKIVNPVQLGLIGLMGFYLYNRLDNKFAKLEDKFSKLEDKFAKSEENVNSKIKELEDEMKSEFKAINARIDKLYDTIIDLYRNLFKKDAA